MINYRKQITTANTKNVTSKTQSSLQDLYDFFFLLSSYLLFLYGDTENCDETQHKQERQTLVFVCG